MKWIKKLFCKHDFVRYWQTDGNMFFHTSKWYEDDFQVDCCNKCGKEKKFKPTAERHKN